MLNLTPTQAALLQRGLGRFIRDPGQVLETDARRVVWLLAQLAARDAAEHQDLEAMQAASDLAKAAQPSPEWITLAAASKLYGVPAVTLRYHAAKRHFELQSPRSDRGY